MSLIFYEMIYRIAELYLYAFRAVVSVVIEDRLNKLWLRVRQNTEDIGEP